MDQTSLQVASTQLANAAQGAVTSVEHSPVILHGGMSMWSLFWGAEPIVKFVMLGLVAASIWSWTV